MKARRDEEWYKGKEESGKERGPIISWIELARLSDENSAEGCEMGL